MAKKAKKKSISKSKSKTASKKTVKKVAKKTASKKAVKKTTAKAATVSKPVKEKVTLETLDQRMIRLSKRLDAVNNVLIDIRKSLDNSKVFNTVNLGGEAPTAQLELFDDKLINEPGNPIPTKEDVSQALQEVMAIAGQDAVRDLLGDVHATKVSDIKEKDYAAILAGAKVITGAKDQDAAPVDNALSLF